MAKSIIKTDVGLSNTQWIVIGGKTPQDHIKVRQGRGGKQFKYVSTSYMISLLNQAFNGMWDFEIVDQQIGTRQIWVRGKLTCKFIDRDKNIREIVKTQYGGSDIKGFDIADDLKAASSDALKKCASMLGFASDIYGEGETYDIEEKTSPAVHYITEFQRKKLFAVGQDLGYSPDDTKNRIKEFFNVEHLNDLTIEQAALMIEKMMKKVKEKPTMNEKVDPNEVIAGMEKDKLSY